MKILYVIDSLTAGGAERSLATLAQYYPSLGIDLDVAYLYDRPGVQAELQDAGAQLFSVEGSSALVRARRTRSLIAKLRPALVHTTLFEADVIGRVAAASRGTPVVSSLVNQSYGPEHAADPGIHVTKLRLAQVLDGTTARLTPRLHAVSHSVAEVMSHRLRYPRHRIDVVPRGRDPERLGTRSEERRSRARQGLGCAPDEIVVIAIGRQEHQKALDVIVRAIADVRREVPAVHLYIAGREGNASDTLRQEVRKSQLEGGVTVLGDRRDVPDLLCAADVFVSGSRREGMPGAVLEAMAMELPIVGTDLPEVLEVTSSRGAILVPTGDFGAMARGIMETLRDPDSAAARTATARARFLSSFTAENIAAAMSAFYEQVLGSGPGPRP